MANKTIINNVCCDITVGRIPVDVHTRRALYTGRFATPQVDRLFEATMFDDKHFKHCNKSKNEDREILI